MPATFSRDQEWAAGGELTDTSLEAALDQIINNMDPTGIGDMSADATAFQTTVDPYPGAAVSLPTDLKGEIDRLRYLVAQITGEAQWYIDPDGSLAAVFTNSGVTFAGTKTFSGVVTFTSSADFASGSAAAPGMTFTGDLDTGIHRIGANNMGIATGGVTAINIDSSQNISFPGSLSIDATVDSTSAVTGSIHTDGGLGVAKALYVGGISTLVGAVTISGQLNPNASVDLAASSSLLFNATPILADSAGTMTLSNVDALDATTEATIESAIFAGSNWPSFSVHRNGTAQTTITGNEKIEWTTEVFDTNSDFDSTTYYRFTPTVAGKYLLSATISWSSFTDGDALYVWIFKNSATYAGTLNIASGSADESQTVTAVVDANGSTDYFEVTAENVNRNTSTVVGTTSRSYFTGCRIG